MTSARGLKDGKGTAGHRGLGLRRQGGAHVVTHRHTQEVVSREPEAMAEC